jgi:hypothetical protein
MGLFPGGKADRAWRWPPTQPSAEVKERLQTLWAFMTRSMMKFTLVKKCFPNVTSTNIFTQGLDLASNLYYRMYDYSYVISFFTQLWNTKHDDGCFAQPKHVAFLFTFIECCVQNYLLLPVDTSSRGWHIKMDLTFYCKKKKGKLTSAAKKSNTNFLLVNILRIELPQ